jgi:hypothetical protein
MSFKEGVALGTKSDKFFGLDKVRARALSRGG